MVEARYSRPFLTYGSIGPSCALARVQGRRAQGLVAQPGPGGAARLAGARARPRASSQVTVLHRQGAGAYGHNTADDAAFDAAFLAIRMPGRTVRVQWSREDEFVVGADQHRHGDRVARRARRRQPAGRLDDRDLEPAACPAPGHERQLQPDRRRGAARRADAQRAQRRAGRARRRRHPQRLRDLRPAAPSPDPSPAAARAAAHLVAARARRLGQRVRDRSPSWTSWRRSPARTP